MKNLNFNPAQFRKAVKKNLSSRLGRVAGRKMFDRAKELITMCIKCKTNRSASSIVTFILVTERVMNRPKIKRGPFTFTRL